MQPLQASIRVNGNSLHAFSLAVVVDSCSARLATLLSFSKSPASKYYRTKVKLTEKLTGLVLCLSVQ